MGIKIFYIIAVAYGVISGLGLFSTKIPDQFGYLFLIPLTAYYLFYAFRKKIKFYNTIIGGIFINLAVQLTGGINSPFFFSYFIVLPIIGYKDKFMNYWIIALGLLIVEALAAGLTHKMVILPLALFGLAILVVGLLIKKYRENETTLRHSLVKYESQEEFFRPANFEHKDIITAVKEIDRHKGIERPLLYYVKFIHNIFNAHTTAIFAYNNSNLTLVQGFSRSELFRPNTVVDPITGLYHQVVTERKSILINDFAQTPEELRFYKGEVSISSAIMAPIILLDEFEGVFAIDRKENRFSEADKILFDEAANTAGLFLSMLRLYEKERTEARYLTKINESAKTFHKALDLKAILTNSVHTFKEAMKCDDVSIASINELANSGTVLASTQAKENAKFSLDDGLVGLVAKQRAYLVKEDLNDGNLVIMKKGERRRGGSFLGMPIQQDDTLLGVIWLEDHRKNKFMKEEVAALNTLATQLSLAWDRSKLYDKVKELSIIDGLTGLYNHRHFHEMLEKTINEQKELVLIFFDIDHFKKINDTYGHLAGDEVLAFLGRLVGQTGIAARYGGEEFAIILPKLPMKKGIEKAIHLKDHIKKSEIKFKQIKIKITVSIGLAHYPNDAKNRIDLIDRADRALYRAKEAGRDQVFLAQSLDSKMTKSRPVSYEKEPRASENQNKDRPTPENHGKNFKTSEGK